MKKTKFYLGVMLLAFFSFNPAFSQCGDCPHDGDAFHESGNEFSATSAQAYFWEVCAGSAAIIGSNIKQTVTVQCNGDASTLKVTRFVNGSCEESCVDFICPVDPPSCPPESCLEVNYQGNPQVCEFAWIQFDPDCLERYACNESSIQLSMDLAGREQIHFPPGQTFGTWNLPPGNWNGTYLSGVATIICGGMECTIKTRVVLDCYVEYGDMDDGMYIGNNPGSSQSNIGNDESREVETVKNGDRLSFTLDNGEKIVDVRIYNMAGQSIDLLLDKSANTLLMNGYKTGIFKAIIMTEKGMYHSSFFAVE